MGIYLFWGQEDFTLEKELSKLKQKYVVPEFEVMSYKVFANPTYDELAEILCTPPFMFSSVFVVIHANGYFGGTKKEISFTDKELKKLDDILQNINENIHVAFVYKIPRDTTKKIDTRRKLYKIIAKYAEVKEFAQFRPYDKNLPLWIKNTAKGKELTISDDCAKYLIEVCGVNLHNLDNELEKIKLYIYPDKNITKNAIKEICNPSEDIFKIIDLYVSGKSDLALNELRKINEKQHYLVTMASLNSLLRNALNLKLMSSKMTPSQISQKTHLHEIVITNQLKKLQNVSAKQLVELKIKLNNAEHTAKNGFWDGELALEAAFLMKEGVCVS